MIPHAAHKVTRVLFIHHSTGANIIKEGKLREKLAKLNPELELWDHSYNLYRYYPDFFSKYTYHTGLTDNNGIVTGRDYNIVLSNNSPKEYAEIFSRNEQDTTLKEILSYDIIAFKNCYPTTKITTPEQFERYKQYYQTIAASLKKFSKHMFIVITPPPLREELTKEEYAYRARELVKWITSGKLSHGSNNIFIFDLFGLLADNNGMLRRSYTRTLWLDSHPNAVANEKVATEFANTLVNLPGTAHNHMH